MDKTIPLLKIKDVRKNFGAIEALRGVSFSINHGEAIALLGDNGAGKSTLVKIISGGLQANGGEVELEGVARTFKSPADAKAAGIETVYQDLSLCTNMDVVANFFMGRELTKSFFGVPFLRKKEMEQITSQSLEKGGTKIPSLSTNVEHLSGGQRQAIELNRFVHWGGKLVLLDEPFAALGVEQTRRGLDMIERIKAEGIGVVIITHVISQAFKVADRIVVLRQGKIAADLKTEEISPDEVVRIINFGSV
jgi:D-xylose transport system ATP-binding protein